MIWKIEWNKIDDVMMGRRVKRWCFANNHCSVLSEVVRTNLQLVVYICTYIRKDIYVYIGKYYTHVFSEHY